MNLAALRWHHDKSVVSILRHDVVVMEVDETL
jgi:hypothetical protein